MWIVAPYSCGMRKRERNGEHHSWTVCTVRREQPPSLRKAITVVKQWVPGSMLGGPGCLHQTWLSASPAPGPRDGAQAPGKAVSFLWSDSLGFSPATPSYPIPKALTSFLVPHSLSGTHPRNSCLIINTVLLSESCVPPRELCPVFSVFAARVRTRYRLTRLSPALTLYSKPISTVCFSHCTLIIAHQSAFLRDKSLLLVSVALHRVFNSIQVCDQSSWSQRWRHRHLKRWMLLFYTWSWVSREFGTLPVRYQS